MLASERRLGFRVPLEIFMNLYVRDRLIRGLTVNISNTGMYLHTLGFSWPDMSGANAEGPAAVRATAVGTAAVGVEIELPGTGEVIWARGQIRYRHGDGYAMGTGLRFTGMPKVYARLVRDFCIEARCRHLQGLLRNMHAPGPRRASASLWTSSS